MWAHFLIIIATDKVINFKTTLFPAGPNGAILRLKARASPALRDCLCGQPLHLAPTLRLLMGMGHYGRKSKARKYDKV